MKKSNADKILGLIAKDVDLHSMWIAVVKGAFELHGAMAPLAFEGSDKAKRPKEWQAFQEAKTAFISAIKDDSIDDFTFSEVVELIEPAYSS